jgi:HEPN domain-containing protein
MAISNKENSRIMLEAAERDIRAINSMLNKIDFAEEIFGFHAQQAVEKSVKAWLSLLNIEYPRTHDLSFLFALLIEADGSAAAFKNLTEFNPYAVQFRYETYDDMDEPLDRVETCSRICKLFHKVKALVK